jgi:predicted RND superfamily exporter protein
MCEVLTRTGPAIMIACVSALCGFGTLINSSYGPLRIFGIVSVVTLTCCLASSIVFLPAFVFQMERMVTIRALIARFNQRGKTRSR